MEKTPVPMHPRVAHHPPAGVLVANDTRGAQFLTNLNLEPWSALAERGNGLLVVVGRRVRADIKGQHALPGVEG